MPPREDAREKFRGGRAVGEGGDPYPRGIVNAQRGGGLDVGKSTPHGGNVADRKVDPHGG